MQSISCTMKFSKSKVVILSIYVSNKNYTTYLKYMKIAIDKSNATKDKPYPK